VTGPTRFLSLDPAAACSQSDAFLHLQSDYTCNSDAFLLPGLSNGSDSEQLIKFLSIRAITYVHVFSLACCSYVGGVLYQFQSEKEDKHHHTILKWYCSEMQMRIGCIPDMTGWCVKFMPQNSCHSLYALNLTGLLAQTKDTANFDELTRGSEV